MFITFHSKVHEKISYFTDIGEKLVHMMGHSGTVPGAIQFEYLPEALLSLKENLAIDDQLHALHDHGDSISLSKRAVPLVHMLQESIDAECAVLWDWSSSP